VFFLLLLYYVVFFGGIAALVQRTRKQATTQKVLGLLQRSFQQIGLGKLDDAEADLTVAELADPSPAHRQLIGMQRALVALRRGALASALPELDALLEAHIKPREAEGAYALRAFVRASLGRHDDARRDIASVRANEHARPESLARAGLAEAMVLFGTGERDALRELLQRDRALILENNHPRERAIARGLQRYLQSSASSVYRVAGPRDGDPPAGDEPELAEWVRRVAPGVAPFVRVPRALTHDRVPAELPQHGVVPRAGQSASARPQRAQAGIALALILFLSMVAIIAWPMLSYMRLSALILPAVGVLGFGTFRIARALVKLAEQRTPRLPSGLAAAATAIGRGNLGDAERSLASLVDDPQDLVAAQAHLHVARVAERRGDFDAALRASERGLGRLTEPQTRAAANTLPMDLAAERALALAALDRSDEAHATIASLAGTYPSRLRAGFRVRLVELVRTGKLAEAKRWAEAYQTDLPLSVREELLADLARAVAAPAEIGPAEVRRLSDELALPESRAWVSRVAPSLLASFEDAPLDERDEELRLRIAPLDASDDEAELEQLATDDADLDPLARALSLPLDGALTRPRGSD
jgi:hypothetical protein